MTFYVFFELPHTFSQTLGHITRLARLSVRPPVEKRAAPIFFYFKRSKVKVTDSEKLEKVTLMLRIYSRLVWLPILLSTPETPRPPDGRPTY